MNLLIIKNKDNKILKIVKLDIKKDEKPAKTNHLTHTNISK